MRTAGFITRYVLKRGEAPFRSLRNGAGRPVLSLEVEARACPLRQLQNSMGGVGGASVSTVRVTYALPASEALTSVKYYSSSAHHFLDDGRSVK
jgi:hypothetical protein